MNYSYHNLEHLPYLREDMTVLKAIGLKNKKHYIIPKYDFPGIVAKSAKSGTMLESHFDS